MDKFVYGAVILAGSDLGLREIRRELRGDFRCYHYRNNALLVQDVSSEDIAPLERLASSYGVWVENTHGKKIIAAEEKEEQEMTLPKVDLAPGYWYKINQDTYPLMHVISLNSSTTPEGKQWVFEVDLVGPGAMPMQMTINEDIAKEYKPKPASLEDFEDLDIVPPSGFMGDPHAIPGEEK
jgi:hypothetical protein